LLQINNHTPFVASLYPCSDIHGRDYAVVIIKGTFTSSSLNHALAVAENQLPIFYADEFYGEAGKSSIKFGSDLALNKKATDIVMLGNAYAPNGAATTCVDITFTINEKSNTVRVIGDRHWQKNLSSWTMSAPKPFEVMPLVYENAFGGKSPNNANNPEEVNCFDQNPVGKGYLAKGGKPYIGMLLPNIEDPTNLINTPFQQPKPAGFGVIARDWQPRLSLAGTYDEAWQTQRMPLDPLDFNPQFFNSAHPNFILNTRLKEGDTFSITNVTPQGSYGFKIPRDQLLVTVAMQTNETTYLATLDTVVIEPDENSVSLTWRVTIPCTRKLLYIDSVTIKRQC
jgi:hypothetical protein